MKSKKQTSKSSEAEPDMINWWENLTSKDRDKLFEGNLTWKGEAYERHELLRGIFNGYQKGLEDGKNEVVYGDTTYLKGMLLRERDKERNRILKMIDEILDYEEKQIATYVSILQKNNVFRKNDKKEVIAWLTEMMQIRTKLKAKIKDNHIEIYNLRHE